ncbi:MAG: FAD binding domain-containing protein [Acidimicrobiia bacterium]
MTVHRPTTIAAAVDALAQAPDALLLAGGTDVMVAVNENTAGPATSWRWPGCGGAAHRHHRAGGGPRRW